jgi:ribosomal protein S18 acetylase RimI-like enzyme
MISVRKAKLKDINKIIDFEKELLNSAFDIINEFKPDNLIDFNLKDDYEKILIDYIKGRIFSKSDAIFIAEKDGKPVGHMIISKKKNYPIFKMENYGRINTVFIKKEFRGLNISSKLKKEAINWFNKKGINRISLNVLPDNLTAIKAYKKWGLSLSLLEMRMTI